MSGIGGTVTVELTSAEPEKSLAALNRAGIEILCLQQEGELTRRFQLQRQDLHKAAGIAAHRGDSLRVVGRAGLYWAFRALLGRPILTGALLFFLTLTIFLPTRILFIRVEGNERLPVHKILAAAEECGVRFGASRRGIRSEAVKNSLLEALPELQWAGVNTAGCVATISVRERPQGDDAVESGGVASLVANRDGYILSVTVTKGTGTVAPGQVVKAGQTLISGYTDCGLLIRATRAEGEVVAQTERDLTVIFPGERLSRRGQKRVHHSVSLIFQKNRINLWKCSGIQQGSCDRITYRFPITLPGGFELPIALCVEEFTEYEVEPSISQGQDVEEALRQFARDYLAEQMDAGQILGAKEHFTWQEDTCRLEGHYLCRERIGEVHIEMIGEDNGEDS